MTPENLHLLLEECWGSATSAASYNDWQHGVPSTGQCAVTALIVQEFFGGRIARAPIPGGSHYWNVLPDGTEVDLTADQFDGGVPPLTDEPEERTVYELLANERTAGRWRTLREKVETALLRQADAILSDPDGVFPSDEKDAHAQD